jgi:hypothetical protein
VLAAFCIAFPLPMSAHRQAQARIAVSGPEPDIFPTTKSATVSLKPRNLADHANWFDVTAWQGAGDGRGGLVIDPLRRVAPGQYRTSSAFPVGGRWKTLLRLHVGNSVQAVPIFLPADPAIPSPEVPAYGQFTRAFVPDKTILQREAVGGSPGLQRAAYTGILAIALLWLGTLAVGLHRMGRRVLLPGDPPVRTAPLLGDRAAASSVR